MAAKIITVFNQKGGCAKTATTMQLAGTFGQRGFKTFVVDMDPQNTSALWALQASVEQPFPAEVLSMAPLKEAFLEKLDQRLDKFDLIFIDCPPALESRVPWVALCASDLAVIPVIPVMDNVWASKQAEELVFAARKARKERGIRGDLHAAYLLSKVKRGKIFDICRDTLAKQAQIPILNADVKERNAFPESQLYGCVVSSFGKSPAAEEVDKVADELAKMLKLKRVK